MPDAHIAVTPISNAQIVGVLIIPAGVYLSGRAKAWRELRRELRTLTALLSR